MQRCDRNEILPQVPRIPAHPGSGRKEQSRPPFRRPTDGSLFLNLQDRRLRRRYESEIRQESIVRDMGALSRFLSVAALEAGRWVNCTKMADVVGVSVNTLRSCCQMLEDTFLGFRVASYATTRKRVVSAPGSCSSTSVSGTSSRTFMRHRILSGPRPDSSSSNGSSRSCTTDACITVRDSEYPHGEPRRERRSTWSSGPAASPCRWRSSGLNARHARA
jgi:hypothetical protein